MNEQTMRTPDYGLSADEQVAFLNLLAGVRCPRPGAGLELEGRKVLVVGAARSGVAAARFLAARGALVVLNDRKEFIDWPNDALGVADGDARRRHAGA